MGTKQLKQELINTGDYTPEEVKNMSVYDLFDNLLRWNGIIGYTDKILSWARPIFEQQEED